MTSKEALQIIRYCYDEEAYETYYDGAKNVHEEELNIIEKDLDRLEKLEKVIEILKKALLLNVKEIRGLYYVLGYDTNYCMTKEEFELLKGVLENDSNKRIH